MVRQRMKFAPGRLSLVCSPLLSLCLLGCGAGSKDVESPAPAPTDEGPPQGSESAASAPEEETEAEASGPAAIPNTCHNGDSPCTASPKWVKRLCSDVYPAVALYLNQPDSPFTRGYLSRKTKAINASGGVTSGDEWLEFDEQVVLLFHRSAGPGGMQVSGAEGGFDAIRWDGSCVTLDGSEVRLQKPPSPKTANIDWRYLGEDVQDALKAVSAPTQIGTRETATATTPRCPKGRRPAFGGFKAPSDGSVMYFGGYFTSAGAWAATAFNSGAPATLTAYSYCLRPYSKRKSKG